MTAGALGFLAANVWALLDGARGVIDPDVEDMVVALRASNTELWDAEDRARAATADAEVAAEKALIDKLNAQRVQLVAELDRALHGRLVRDPSAPPCTETPGSVCDRLSILHLRIRRTAARAADGTDHVGGRLPGLRAQAAELGHAFEILLDDLREGRRSFTVHPPYKLYGAPAAEPSSAPPADGQAR
ncbi:MAG TPA: DUF4254 domain-containing protein [Acidimicrobiales bacterium]